MLSRVLKEEEYPRLKGTELENVWPLFPPGTQVIVVEEEGKITAHWALVPFAHAEGIWITPEKRGRVGTVRLLVNTMYEVARKMGMKTILTGSLDEKVDVLIKKLKGVELPGKQFVINIQENI